MKKADLVFNVIRLPVDFIMLLSAGLAAYFLRTNFLAAYRPVLFQSNLPPLRYLTLVAGVSILFLISYAIAGLYSMKVRIGRLQEFGRIAVASSAGIMLVIIYIFLQQYLFNSRFLVLGAWLLGIAFVFIGRLIIRSVQTYAVVKHNYGVHRLLLIGNDETSKTIYQAIEQDPATGYRVVKHLETPDLSELSAAVGNPGVDEVILGNPHYSEEQIVQLVEFCQEHHLVFKYVPNVYQTLTQNFDIDLIHQTPVIELKRTPLDGWGRVFKRIVDVVFSLAALIVLSPFFILIGLAIKLDSSGSVLVKLKRTSRNREFNLFKFRSMVQNAEELKSSLSAYNERNDGPLFKMHNDPRVTRVGRFLRRLRWDEMPQFLNIIKGDISLVGPRPHQPDEIAQYQSHHKKVLAIKAGATGLAQISGSSDLPFEEEVRLDSFYIENWSIWQDTKIVLKTIWKLFNDRSAV